MLPTAGGAAAIDLTLGIRRGAVHVQQPTFGEYAERAKAHGRRMAANQAIQADDTVVICNPNNPTGTLLSPNDVLRMHRDVRNSGGELIVDEAFIDYCPDGTVRHHVQDGLTVVGSLTKILCIPGVRLGYICAAPEQIARLQERAVTWSLNVLASAVAAELPPSSGGNCGGCTGESGAGGAVRAVLAGDGRACDSGARTVPAG